MSRITFVCLCLVLLCLQLQADAFAISRRKGATGGIRSARRHRQSEDNDGLIDANGDVEKTRELNLLDLADVYMAVTDKASASELASRLAKVKPVPNKGLPDCDKDNPLTDDRMAFYQYFGKALRRLVEIKVSNSAAAAEIIKTYEQIIGDKLITKAECSDTVKLAAAPLQKRQQVRFMSVRDGDDDFLAAWGALAALDPAILGPVAGGPGAGGPAHPLRVKLWTASTPCQSTKAFFGWFVQQHPTTYLAVSHTFAGTGPGLNGITNWRNHVTGQWANIMNAINDANPKIDATQTGGQAEPAAKLRAIRAHHPGNYAAALDRHFTACLNYLGAMPVNVNDQSLDAAALATAAGQGGGCARACLLAFGGETGYAPAQMSLRSCSIATAQLGPGVVHPYLALSGVSKMAAATLPAAVKFAPDNSRPIPAGAVAAAAFGVWPDGPRTSPRYANRLHWHNACAARGLAAVAVAHRDLFPDFEGRCSEDKILNHIHAHRVAGTL